MNEFLINLWDNFVLGLYQIFVALRDIRIFDVIDILVVAFVIYKTIGFIRETRAKLLIKGVIVLLAVWIFAQWFNLISIKWLLVKILDYAIIAVAIIFQPELRNALEKVGHSKFGMLVSRQDSDGEEIKTCIDAVCKACGSMKESRVGALIVFERSSPLGEIISTGTTIDSKTSQELLCNVFYPKSPLHDGGLVVRNGRMVAAGCILPLTANNQLSKELGTRHRAAVGMSESSDAIVVVVSEETGNISIANNGLITRNYDSITLKEELLNQLVVEENTEKSNAFKRIFKGKKQDK